MKSFPFRVRLPGRSGAACSVWLCLALLLIPGSVRAVEPDEIFFESSVRPLLVEQCGGCHGANKRAGGLRVDSLTTLLEGGDRGPAIVPGEADASLLMAAVRRQGDLEMPPEGPLDSTQLEVLERWIERGAPWPASDPAPPPTIDHAEHHWAFQEIQRPPVPRVSGRDWIRTPIDAFVLAQLEASRLSPAPVADRRTLIRRLSYALVGTPPTQSDVDRFVADTHPAAYERLVDRLLNSPQFGEHWARHWLDIARYSDTKGYVYAREERHWIHAWAYRDWVVQAFNDDLPYDRFLQLQLAADQVDDRRPGDLAAMGFLTLGRRFLGVERDIIDDRIDVVCRGMMGLTVACARCHDHKYDPIPTGDYYSLYGVFDSSREQRVRLPAPAERRPHAALLEAPASTGADRRDPEFEQELAARQQAFDSRYAEERRAASERARDRVTEYLLAQTELQKYPPSGFDQIFQADDLLPAFVRRWSRYLMRAQQTQDPVFTAWHAFAALPAETFSTAAPDVAARLVHDAEHDTERLIAAAFVDPPDSFREVCRRYGRLFQQASDRWQAAVAAAEAAGGEPPQRLAEPGFDALRQVLEGPHSPSRVPAGGIVDTEAFFPTEVVNELWKLQGEVDRWLLESPAASPYGVILVDRAVPIEPRIFRRGDPTNLGPQVTRQFLSVLRGDAPRPFQRGSGRRELANAIVDPDNPLTARVIVNRVWAQYFGQGLVETPSDFGTRAAPPSHPALLDWLAAELIADRWSLKELHRTIVLSAAFRQASAGPADADVRERALVTDPENRLLWRITPRRLTFEELRDSLFAVTGDLDGAVGGRPTRLFEQPYPPRRALYGLVDRQYLPGTLRMFDFANPDLHTPRRSETTVPQQALFFMNHPLILQRARRLAELSESIEDRRARVQAMFARVFQRQPTDREIDEAIALVASAAVPASPVRRSTPADWRYGYGSVDSQTSQVADFTALPHFTGNAWQGGPDWPDQTLGWAQLTATGGHPGNDQDHAVIRRWTAPERMTLSIRSKLAHEPSEGDGIRARILSAEHGELLDLPIHQDSDELDIAALEVSGGTTIDFVVDIGGGLNNDQFLWAITIEQTDGPHRPVRWDSVEDFPQTAVAPLVGWEQLAQLLLCTNEFFFVD